ncbi:MAG: Ig-like domain-containing protein [Isosphaeraceae bacterium]|nr:Ig-like domain-containing protein [Isosphaeraceae bacterium]
MAVTSVTANHGAIVINNNMIPQPDTIGIAFNQALNTRTVNADTIHLVTKTGPNTYSNWAVIDTVTYSPTNDTAYLTPESALVPGTIYYVEVDTTVSNATNFPATGGTLAKAFYTSFEVNGPRVGLGQSPLTVTATSPANGTQWTQTAPLGYVSVTFSEPINLSSLGRYSVMLIPKEGSGYADVPLNAKLAFNPNTNTLVIVPATGLLPWFGESQVFLIALSGITASNGDTLGNAPVYESFAWSPPWATLAVSAQRANPVPNAATVPAVTPSPVVSPYASSSVVAPASGAGRVAASAHASTSRLARPAQTADRLASLGGLLLDRRPGRFLAG